MEETRKSPNDGGNKKMVIRGGGGGAVVMLGGALATAAFISTFACRRKRRSSGEDSSPQINENKIIREGGEQVELENDFAVMSSDRSFELVETDEENDAVSDGGLTIVEEKIPLLVEKFKVELVKEDVSDDHSREDDEMKELQQRQEENSRDDHDKKDNAVEEVITDQTIEFEGLCHGNGEIAEEKCVEKTILPLFESPIQQDDLIDDHEKHKQNHLGDKFSFEDEGENGPIASPSLIVTEELDGANIQVAETSLHFSGKTNINDEDEEEKKVENGEATLWRTESTHQVKLMKYEEADSSTMRVIIWMICVLTSLSCSWFFDLSYVKLGLFLFLTVFLLEIYGF